MKGRLHLNTDQKNGLKTNKAKVEKVAPVFFGGGVPASARQPTPGTGRGGPPVGKAWGGGCGGGPPRGASGRILIRPYYIVDPMPAAAPSIPFLDLYAGNRRVETAFFRDLKTLFRRSDFIGGPTVETFERAFAADLGAPHCVAVSSGTAALHLSLIAAGIGPGDEVIVPAFTFPGAALPVLHGGARPVFADVNPGDGCLDPASVARVTTKNTRAILVTHLFGHPADLDALQTIARESRGRIRLIEDAAQAHGGSWRGRALGTCGAFGCFSFYPTKNLGAWGDAGAILVKTRAHAERLRRLRDHGQGARFRPLEPGFNARMDAV